MIRLTLSLPQFKQSHITYDYSHMYMLRKRSKAKSFQLHLNVTYTFLGLESNHLRLEKKQLHPEKNQLHPYAQDWNVKHPPQGMQKFKRFSTEKVMKDYLWK